MSLGLWSVDRLAHLYKETLLSRRRKELGQMEPPAWISGQSAE